MMTDGYVLELVKAYPEISEVWLIGSRAQGAGRPDSDWDYLVFANVRVLRSLRQRARFNSKHVDLLVVHDGCHFSKPWRDDDRTKKGSLKDWEWHRTSPTTATYRAAKFDESGDFTSCGHGRRVWPQP